MVIARREDDNMMDDFENQLRAMELPVPVDVAIWLASEPEEPDQIIEDTFDKADKLAIIAASKLRKSFFLLQLLICIGAGRPFLNWKIPKPRRILHVQFEIQEHHYHRRLIRMAKAMGITPGDLGDRFYVLNARGLGMSGPEAIKKITHIAQNVKADVISFDPLYKVITGAENAAEDLKGILNAFDELAKETGAAIIYVHHDPKGNSGDRDVRDRGAGSNVLGRDYDACITLTPHASEPAGVVVESLLRNYKPQEAFVALWAEDTNTEGYCFNRAYGIAPTKKTSSNGKAKDTTALGVYLPVALEILKSGPMQTSVFMDAFRTKTGLTHARSSAFRDWAMTGSRPALGTHEKRGRGQHEKLIGTPEQLLRLKDQA